MFLFLNVDLFRSMCRNSSKQQQQQQKKIPDFVQNSSFFLFFIFFDSLEKTKKTGQKQIFSQLNLIFEIPVWFHFND